METLWIIAAVVALHLVSIGIASLVVRDLIHSDQHLPRRPPGGEGSWRWRRRPPAGDRPHGGGSAAAPAAARDLAGDR